MKLISDSDVHSTLTFPELINVLERAFSKPFTMPQRKVFELSQESHDAFALLPAWDEDVIGTKAFTYFPDNVPPFQSLYSKIMLFDRKNGSPLAFVDGTSVTYWRTAAASALASRYLSRHDSSTLLLFGTGNLAPFMIKAHCSERPIKHVIVCGRNENAMRRVIEIVSSDLPNVSFNSINIANLDRNVIQSADIISCATGSHSPLFNGQDVQSGTFIDLIGNHSADRRECDSYLIENCNVYVDSKTNVLNEAGELLIPIKEGIFTENSIKAELSQLCTKTIKGRQNENEVTVYKSVGTALSDLVTAHHVFKSLP